LATAQSVFVQLLDSGFDRSGTIIALGGTVISEFAGFVAATYMRGVDCVQCPTSLLAMVDTSIGGKTGLDLPRGKNIIGAFKQPKAVIADVATLQSLPPRAFASGMAEVIKHSLIADTDLFNKIEAGNWKRESDAIPLPLSDLQTLVAQAIQVKINIIQEDPFEQGRRTVLNLGHTFAHAIEQVSDFTVRHGEAVAMGLVAAANLSARMGFCSSALQERIESALAGAALPTRVPGNVSPELLLAAMSRDKKRTAGRLRFVLMRGIGDVFVTDAVDQTEVLASLKELSS
jgi:3-dehydroquinate synthase